MIEIRFLSALIHMNLIVLKDYREKVCVGQFVVNEKYSYICLRVFPILSPKIKLPHPQTQSL